MTKKNLLILTAALCLMAAGCEMKDIDYSEREESTAETTTVTTETTTELTTTTTTETTTVTETTTTETTVTAPAEDINKVAQALYDAACSRIFGMFCSTYYETSSDYIMDETEWIQFFRVTDSRVKTVEDVKADFLALFTEDFYEIYQTDIDNKFRMIDGNLYCALGERGSDITYIDTELTLTSNRNGVAIFTAVSHYASEETDEVYPDETAEFILVQEDGVWRVDKFTLPF